MIGPRKPCRELVISLALFLSPLSSFALSYWSNGSGGGSGSSSSSDTGWTKSGTEIYTTVVTDEVGIGTQTPRGLLDIWNGTTLMSDGDVAHGVTDHAPTNAYASFAPNSGTTGGLFLQGFSEDATSPMYIRGTIGTQGTSNAPITLDGVRANGIGVASIDTTNLVFEFLNNGTSVIEGYGNRNVFIGNDLLMGGSGTETSPAIRFSADTNTGIYRVASDRLGLVVGGVLTFDVNATLNDSPVPLHIPDGAAATPALVWRNDTNTGLFRAGTDQTGFAQGGAEVARLNTTGLGIGHTAPAAKLHAVGADNSTVIISSINATQANITAADIFIGFYSNEGLEGSVAGTAAAGVLAYNTFTGSHWTKIEGQMPDVLTPLESTGEPYGDEKAQLVKTRVCKTKRSKAILGFYAGTDPEGRSMALALGTGYAIVSNHGQDVEIGDWLMTSDVEGTVERQEDDLQHNYSVAKSLQPIKWQKGEKTRKIAVTYHAG